MTEWEYSGASNDPNIAVRGAMPVLVPRCTIEMQTMSAKTEREI